MKVLVLIVSLVFSAYSGVISYLIATTGTVNHIPQLVGEGGAGFCFCALLLIAATLLYIRPMAAIPIYLLATLEILFAGLYYEDSSLYIWGACSTVLAAVSFYLEKLRKTRKAISSKSLSS